MFASQVHQGDWTLFVCVAPLATSFGQTLNEAAINTPQLTKSATDLAGSVYQCLNATQTYRWHINRERVTWILPSVNAVHRLQFLLSFFCRALFSLLGIGVSW